jgi:uncharacterized protein YraI
MSGTSRASANPLRCANILMLAAMLLSAAGAAVVVDPKEALAASATTTSEVNLRVGYRKTSKVKLVIPAGSRVDIVNRSQNGYYKVVYQGVRGYAHGDFLDFGWGSSGGGGGGAVSSGGQTGNATIITSLNLRAGPSTSDRVLAVMPTGATVNLTGESANGFVKVDYNGTQGWAYAQFVGEYGSVEAPPSNVGGPSGSYDTNGDGAWSRDEIVAIIYAAAAYYGQSGDAMLQVAICESGLDPYNVTPPYSASGLFQFLPGTWATTPYAGASIFDPVASAFATGWMWANGRRGEWVC